MQLDERKTRILQAIIRNYLETGEPVGSRTISKYTDLHLSSATIRNEMADLEELGYILQPHTSAGRIPSDKGYRFYVDAMMEAKERENREATALILERQNRMELMLKQVVKVLAQNTNYASMIAAPSPRKGRLKFIQLSRMEERQLLAVVVTEGNMIRNNLLDLDRDLSDEALLKLNMLVNTHLAGLSLEEIHLGRILELKGQAGEYGELVGHVIEKVAQAFGQDAEDLEIYTSGAENIFRYPELADNQKASLLINTLEEKQLLGDLMQEALSDESGTGIQVYIGRESPVNHMQDCSVVTATYQLEGGMRGSIGIIGPKRMDYDKVISTLRDLQEQMDNLYKKDGG